VAILKSFQCFLHACITVNTFCQYPAPRTIEPPTKRESVQGLPHVNASFMTCQTTLLLCIRGSGFLRSQIPSGICAKLRTVAASNNRDHVRNLSFTIACSRYIYNGVGELHIQCNTTGEVATTSPPFYKEPHRSHILWVKAELRKTFTSWLQHHFDAIGNPERHIRKVLHCGSKQQ